MITQNPEKPFENYEACYKGTPEHCVKCNCRVKYYPNFGSTTTIASTAVFKRAGFERVKKISKVAETSVDPEPIYITDSSGHMIPLIDDVTARRSIKTPKARDRPDTDKEKEVRKDSVKRAIDGIFDIVLLNDWKYFITGTFDDNILNASDVPLVVKRVQKWLNHCVCRKGLKYLLVPEYHPSSGRIHFHGLINDSLSMTDSGRVCFKGQAYTRESVAENGLNPDDYKTIYNISDWRFGFSTAIPTDDNRLRLAGYVTKYVTKDLDKIFGRFYWHSRNIDSKPVYFYSDVEYGEIDSPEYFPSNTYVRYKYLSDFMG